MGETSVRYVDLVNSYRRKRAIALFVAIIAGMLFFVSPLYKMLCDCFVLHIGLEVVERMRKVLGILGLGLVDIVLLPKILLRIKTESPDAISWKIKVLKFLINAVFLIIIILYGFLLGVYTQKSIQEQKLIDEIGIGGTLSNDEKLTTIDMSPIQNKTKDIQEDISVIINITNIENTNLLDYIENSLGIFMSWIDGKRTYYKRIVVEVEFKTSDCKGNTSEKSPGNETPQFIQIEVLDSLISYMGEDKLKRSCCSFYNKDLDQGEIQYISCNKNNQPEQIKIELGGQRVHKISVAANSEISWIKDGEVIQKQIVESEEQEIKFYNFGEQFVMSDDVIDEFKKKAFDNNINEYRLAKCQIKPLSDDVYIEENIPDMFRDKVYFKTNRYIRYNCFFNGEEVNVKYAVHLVANNGKAQKIKLVETDPDNPKDLIEVQLFFETN